MFKKSNKESQLDAFARVPNMLENSAFKQYSDIGHWHNQFREQVLMRIDETIFSVLFNNTMGAPNAPVRILVGMMILKESFVWSDSQLFEHCRFNLLVRSALDLFNMNDSLPVESTYYLMRNRMYDHQKQSGDDLMGKAFAQITNEQVKEFDVNGRSIRMDSKLICSNIALFSRYEIIHHTFCIFFNSLGEVAKSRLLNSDLEQLEKLKMLNQNTGLIKQKTWTFCRCLWINLVPILNFMKQICQRTFKTIGKSSFNTFLPTYFNLQIVEQLFFRRIFSIVLFLSIIVNFKLFK